MSPPVWVPGQVLTASDVNTWFVPLVGMKGADTTVTSQTTPQNDASLVIALAANATYEVRMSFSFACTANGVSTVFQFTIPSGATGFYNKTYWTGSTTQQTSLPDAWTAARTGFIDNTRDWGVDGHGVIATTNSGNLQVQWAQNASSATAVTWRKYSILSAVRVT